MLADNIRWSRRPWTLKDFPENLQTRLRKLEANQPILSEKVNGDNLYVRRVGLNRYQCGLVAVWNEPGAGKETEH